MYKVKERKSLRSFFVIVHIGLTYGVILCIDKRKDTNMVLAIILVTFLIRLIFLKRSIENEKRILSNGGQEFGVENTKRLTLAHIIFYLSCFVEAMVHKTNFDGMSMVGLVLLIFSMLMLMLVIHLLGDIWTVKLMLVNNHKFVDHFLFRTVKHPNYFLNILPELVGLALVSHAYVTFIFIFPVYAVILYQRIAEEEKLLQEVIIPNGRMKG
ncbi:isoprenylcysteine carboxyl methyltransferase [Streptococcus agalactiae CCUG 47293]|nr:Isoprenylcysteine carboxyl methyltransferase (ICMT) family family [Streptococcus agalactiae H36B]EPT73289.1 isoprenylcysteine carboxyl methyltransferase [Streptococcus agalactiae CCUG 39096 A]EPT82771.1 isoprenylcysteine carboxyl methyltransferase [Streptococcus agalactiae BSU450]EPT89616.1 isoprenylcysteine carboxyl methyltransferase [Streptococcus agalactiae BSU178]EPU08430.1 isoprenylcysteine carboxyl methyltransferase [Streptococcus agalactiae STIR-CD-21]EPU11132.1 isoprenylcysteine car